MGNCTSRSLDGRTPFRSTPTLNESIDYSIRSNAMEGLVSSEETLAMLRQVAAGELTFEDMRKAIKQKARELASKPIY